MHLIGERHAMPTNPEYPSDLSYENLDALSWTQRRDLACQTIDSIERDGLSEQGISLLFALADDPKWEVRKEVAHALLLVPDEHFAQLTAKLIEDPNKLVQYAAERALDRRRRGSQVSERKQKELMHVKGQYDSIEKKYGPEAAAMALKMAERHYDTLVGATVHDMKNILTPLQSEISILKAHLNEGNLDIAHFRKYLEKMQHQSETLLRMIEDILTYSQMTPDERHRERIIHLVNEAHTMVLDAFEASERYPSEVNISIEVPDNLMVDVARYQIIRAISNVIKNAYEAFAIDPLTFKTGQIHVLARAIDRERIEIIVKDNGMGLPPDELAEVCQFTPGGTSKKAYGTGFGLPIAKRKIEDHRGALRIDSTEDIGTKVTITLPIEAGGEVE
jgi:signal transduction histidine kinase